MICKDNLVTNLKEMALGLQNKQYMNELMGIKDYQLDNIVKILELCQDTIKDGSYDEGWSDAMEKVKTILDSKGIIISEIEDL